MYARTDSTMDWMPLGEFVVFAFLLLLDESFRLPLLLMLALFLLRR
jgi:multidrug efflux pump subunit AcrB